MRSTPEEAQRLAAARPVDPEAHRQVLIGSYAMSQALTQRAGIEKGIEHFRKAIEIDPGFALAHTRLAGGLRWLGGAGYRATRDACAEARAETEKALTLDPHQAEALALLAELLQSCEFDWAGAERDYRRALAALARLDRCPLRSVESPEHSRESRRGASNRS